MTVIPRNDAAVRRLSAAFLAQADRTVAWLDALQTEDLERATSKSTVRGLVGEVLMGATDLVQTLPRSTAARAVGFSALVQSERSVSAHQHQLMRSLLDDEPDHRLAQQVDALYGEITYLLSRELPESIDTPYGAARTSDYLRLASMGLVRLSDALAQALPWVPMELVPACVNEAARGFATLVGEAHPGRNVELRVPPAAAVQVGDGIGRSTHRRGTPPTVVECSPLVFVRLCVGTLTWEDALRTFAVSASGAHADLGHVFPIWGH